MSTSEIVRRYPNFKPSADTLRLFHFLEESEENVIIKYSTLSAIIDRDAQKAGRRYVYAALTMMRNEYSALFGVVPNIGIIRLRNSEKQGVLDNRVRRAQGQVRRGLKEAKTVNLDLLSDAEKRIYNVTLSVFGALNHFASPRVNKRLGSAVDQARQPIELNRLVELFNRKK